MSNPTCIFLTVAGDEDTVPVWMEDGEKQTATDLGHTSVANVITSICFLLQRLETMITPLWENSNLSQITLVLVHQEEERSVIG